MQLNREEAQAAGEWIDLAAQRRALAHADRQTERVERLRELAGEHAKLVEAQKAVAAELETAQAAVDAAEANAETLRARIAKDEDRLNSGEGLISSELVILQKEIDGLKSQLDAVETEEVEAIDAAEAVAAKQAALGERASAVAAEGRSLQAERKYEAERMSAQAAGLDEQIAAVVGRLPQALRARVSGSAGEYPALARLAAGACGACGSSLSGAALSEVTGDGGTAECEDCSAVLIRRG